MNLQLIPYQRPRKDSAFSRAEQVEAAQRHYQNWLTSQTSKVLVWLYLLAEVESIRLRLIVRVMNYDYRDGLDLHGSHTVQVIPLYGWEIVNGRGEVVQSSYLLDWDKPAVEARGTLRLKQRSRNT